MKKEQITRYPNGNIKCLTKFHWNNTIKLCQYFNKNGKQHGRGNTPDFYTYHTNGRIEQCSFFKYGLEHNINNPSWCCFDNISKMVYKEYAIKNIIYNKLKWTNLIKNI